MVSIMVDAILGFILACFLLTAATPYPPPQYPDDSFDYVVVGAGPAGFVLAEQLSRNPHFSVLLLEAGGDGSSKLNITVPGFAGNNDVFKNLGLLHRAAADAE